MWRGEGETRGRAKEGRKEGGLPQILFGCICGDKGDLQFALYRMRKKINREKDSRLTIRDKPCKLCLPSSPPQDIPPYNLRKKYYDPQV